MTKRNFAEPVLALFVRFLPEEWSNWPCMRVEVYGEPESKEIYHQIDGLNPALDLS